MLEFGYNGVFAGDGIIDWQTRTLYLFPSLAYRVRRLLFCFLEHQIPMEQKKTSAAVGRCSGIITPSLISPNTGAVVQNLREFVLGCDYATSVLCTPLR